MEISIHRDTCCGNHQTQSPIAAQGSKSLKLDIKWKVHKRTQQGVSSILEFYLYKTCLVHATNNQFCPYVHVVSSCSPYFLLKTTILFPCALMSSSSSFHYVLGLMASHHVTCHVTAVSCASSSSKRERNEKRKTKEKQNPYVVRK